MTDRKLETEAAEKTNKSNVKVAAICGFVFFAMVGLSFAAVPLYQIFCQVTGYGGTTQRADEASSTILDREIIVSFDANVAPGLDWDFKPKQRKVRVKLGQMTEIMYQATSTADQRSTGTSTFNVAPFEVGGYFNKIDCFCFTEQPLQAGESIDMPVVFFIDPEMDKDENLKKIKEITLSYTFFELPKDGEDETAAVVSPNNDTTDKL
ncbi:Cytochrome c oxidase assembly protein CtaG [Pseudovibrio axinellae]|uniref:Cytochrome c oxidase assembly protein CtaG n=1 Tax=Pseudovibrio axinellae TaxID=989403 RepID=A0A165YE12_9HYPH|nr:cytochrome c oxidase assembly protein [Pseudovibrio axinellae]KZL18759.1 Cytochrome c oxidase assembly protein CtaG [Pseudovibrio axinellae]SEP93850.1 cytochrome c oxidase assembly protein subunit 11 [Pseudovibrio axinellae]